MLRSPWTVGRDAEKLLLGEAVGAAAAGHGGAVFLLGDAGIGKSRLAADASVEARSGRGMAALHGRCVGSAPAAPLRPLAEALCGALRMTGEPRAADLAAFRPVLGRLVPEWRVADADLSLVALAEGVLRFLRAVAGRRGALLALDDLQWADVETLAVVEYLADNLTDQRVLLLVAARPEPAAAAELAETLRRRGAARLVPLGRLEARHTAALVSGCLRGGGLPGDRIPAEVLALAARAEGHPYHVEELLAGALASGALVTGGVTGGGSWRLAGPLPAVVPGAVAAEVGARLARLGAAARAVVTAAAVLGDTFTAELVADLADLPQAQGLEGLREAVAAQLVVPDRWRAGEPPGHHRVPGAFRFRHALTRDAVLDGLLAPEVAAVSRRALAAFAARPEEADVALQARLAEAAGEPGRAAALLVRIGRAATAAGTLAAAETTLRRALELAGDDAVAADAGQGLVEVQSLAGRWEDADAAGAAALRRLSGPAAAGRRADLHLGLARAAVTASDWAGARRHVGLARAGTPVGTPGARADVLEALAALGADLPGEARALAVSALAGAEAAGLPEVACEALEVLGRCERWRDLAAAEAVFGRALALAEEHGLGLWRVRALHELGTIDLLERGDVARLEEARGLALAAGALARVADLDVQIAAGLVGRDDPGPALDVAVRAAELAGRLGLGPTRGVALGFAGTAHARAGRGAEMEACLAGARELLPAGGDIGVLAAGARVYLAFARDTPADALAVLEAEPAARDSPPFAGTWALLAAVERGDDAGTADVRGRGEPVEVFGRAYLRYAEAVAAGRSGQGAEALAHLRAADAHLASFGWFRHYGRRLVAPAALAAGWGEPVAWLREAQDFFDAHGSARPAATCRALLRGAGVAVRRRGRGDAAVPDALRALGVTAREADVLALVAAGLTDREIASELVLSPRTVQTHVASLLAKTGAAGRRDLGRLARRPP